MDRAQYRSHVEGYVSIARLIRAEHPDITREELVHELHEWLNAPESPLHTWEGEDADDVRALEVLTHTANRAEAVAMFTNQGVVGVDFPFLAAWALVADVMDALGPAPKRPPIPYEEPPIVDEDDRESLIKWLIWNDPNGCYADDEMLEELGSVLTLDEARAQYRCQSGHDSGVE